MKIKIFDKFVYSSIRQLYCCDITDCSRVPPETATYKNLIKTLKKIKSWLKLLYKFAPTFANYVSKIIFHLPNLPHTLIPVIASTYCGKYAVLGFFSGPPCIWNFHDHSHLSFFFFHLFLSCYQSWYSMVGRRVIITFKLWIHNAE